ncbi:MAG: hypothetical protein PHS75_10465 [Anaerolineaceae bacterium]|nr:hypothetical protein [Anaerolineaceae bacterium]
MPRSRLLFLYSPLPSIKETLEHNTFSIEQKNSKDMLRKFFSKKDDSQKSEIEKSDNEENEIPKLDADTEIVKIVLEDFIKKYSKTNVIDMETVEKITGCILKGLKHIEITKDKLDDLEAKRIKQQQEEDTLRSTAKLNSKGMFFEKSGEIEKAIEVYEQNIKSEYPATHSYERLMILYRKRKEYENENRVIELAIKVFSIENQKRFDKAMTEAADEKTKQDIKDGFHTGQTVRRNDGWVIYNPYPVHKYKSRLDKVHSLINKK